MTDVPDLRPRRAARLDDDRCAAARSLLDEAFAGRFTDEDWEHALGGTHVWIEDGAEMVAHASVVPRVLWVGQRLVGAGYVEAVAVAPSRQRNGLGTTVMEVIDDVIVDLFALGALSTGARTFYERLGWERWRGPTWIRRADGTRLRSEDEDDGLMILRTPAMPDVDPTSPLMCEERSGDCW